MSSTSAYRLLNCETRTRVCHCKRHLFRKFWGHNDADDDERQWCVYHCHIDAVNCTVAAPTDTIHSESINCVSHSVEDVIADSNKNKSKDKSKCSGSYSLSLSFSLFLSFSMLSPQFTAVINGKSYNFWGWTKSSAHLEAKQCINCLIRCVNGNLGTSPWPFLCPSLDAIPFLLPPQSKTPDISLCCFPKQKASSVYVS